MLLHPERNTSLILRAEILSDGAPLNIPAPLNYLRSYVPARNLLRRLLPRQRNRDPVLDQDCVFMRFSPHGTSDRPATTVRMKSDEAIQLPESTLVILCPRIDGEGPLPWYHPPIRYLAFRYLPTQVNEPPSAYSASPHMGARIRLEVVLMNPSQDAATLSDPKSRLYRTCLLLLETLFRYGKGKMNGYRKRVVHDVRSLLSLIPSANITLNCDLWPGMNAIDARTERGVSGSIYYDAGSIQGHRRYMARVYGCIQTRFRGGFDSPNLC